MSSEIEYKLLDELLSNINQVLFVRDAFSKNHDIIYVNNAYESLWGRSKQSLIDNPASYIESVHPDDREMVVRLYIEFLEGNLEYEKDFRIIRANGDIRWIFAKTFAIFNEKGEVYRIAGIAEDITNRKESELNIKRFNDVQSGVLKMLAHDLRTPIAGIKLMASLIESSSEEKVEEITNNIVDCCDNTLNMMDDLLSHIQMTGKGVSINLTSLIIEDEIRKVCDDFNLQFSHKEVKFNLPTTNTSVNLDSIKFKQILSNLVTNAIKFSHTKGIVSISVEEFNSHVNLVIKDNGVGISEELLPEVFDIFTRARREGTNGEKSSGIGLSITKRLVELHNATINVSSKLNKGTEILISFPK